MGKKTNEEIIDEYLELPKEDNFEWIFNVKTQKWYKELKVD